jgi:Domain of unknown function (DUF4143)
MIRLTIHDELISGCKRSADSCRCLVESCVGAHLLNSSYGTNIQVTYWRERDQEVDFVLQQGKTTVSIEVKSGGRREVFPGMEAFARQFKPHRQLQVKGTENPGGRISFQAGLRLVALVSA